MPSVTLSPLMFLQLTLVTTIVCACVYAIRLIVWRRRLMHLAARWQMNFTPRDRLRLADRVVGAIPCPGAADLYVHDMLFRSDGSSHRYIFTAEYTIGLIHNKRRQFRAVAVREPVRGSGTAPLKLTLSSNELPLFEQYRNLLESGA